MTGLHCGNTNHSLDKVIAQNKWCVKFVHVTDEGKEVPYDLVQNFTVRFWLEYTTKMVVDLTCSPCLFGLLVYLACLFTLLADRTPSRHAEVGPDCTRVPNL